MVCRHHCTYSIVQPVIQLDPSAFVPDHLPPPAPRFCKSAHCYFCLLPWAWYEDLDSRLSIRGGFSDFSVYEPGIGFALGIFAAFPLFQYCTPPRNLFFKRSNQILVIFTQASKGALYSVNTLFVYFILLCFISFNKALIKQGHTVRPWSIWTVSFYDFAFINLCCLKTSPLFLLLFHVCVRSLSSLDSNMDLRLYILYEIGFQKRTLTLQEKYMNT